MDAFVFLKQLSPASLQRLVEMVCRDRDEIAIRAVGELTGEYDAVVFVDAEGLDEVRRVVQERIRIEAGIPLAETYVAMVPPERPEKEPAPPPPGPEPPPPQPGGPPPKPQPDAPKRRDPLGFDALLHVRTKPGKVREAYWDLFRTLPGNPIGPGLQGEARITGPWDLLVEVGADTYEDLCGFIDDVANNEFVAETAPALMRLLARA